MSTGDPPTRAGSFGSISCEVTAPFLSLGVSRFCVCPPSLGKPLFPLVLWKSCNQIPLGFKVRVPGDRQAGKPTWGSEPSQHRENIFGIIVLIFVGHPPSGHGIRFCHDCTLLPSCCGFFFVFGCGVPFGVAFSILLLMAAQQRVVTLLVSQELSTHPLPQPSWTERPAIKCSLIKV